MMVLNWKPIGMKRVGLVGLLTFLGFYSVQSHAELVKCPTSSSRFAPTKICQDTQLKKLRRSQDEQMKQTLLFSDAPRQYLLDSRKAWERAVMKCVNTRCLTNEFQWRENDLSILETVAQQHSQHYLRVVDGDVTVKPAMLSVHSLNEKKQKIEVTAYQFTGRFQGTDRSQFLGYAKTDKQYTVKDLKSKCNLKLTDHQLYIEVEGQQSKCKAFDGVYRLYD